MDKTPKDIFHRVDGGSFEIKDTNYDYVIEQNMGKDPTHPGNLRVRVVKQKPVVKTIRTRYEPHIEIDGDTGSAMPSFWGYDLKRLYWLLFISPILLLLLAAAFTTQYWMQLITISLPANIGNMVAKGLLAFCIGYLVMFFLVPLGAVWYRNLKMYLFLKKHAVDYSQREVTLDELAPKNL